MSEGIYACFVTLHYDGARSEGPYPAAMHYGPRPVFHDTVSCEIHVIDVTPSRPPQRIEVQIVARLRDVEDFPSVDALREQMRRDIEEARERLKK